MYDIDQEDSGRNFGPVVGFALGALVGGVAAVLLAPESGEVTRRRLQGAARELGRNARQVFDEKRSQVAETVSGIREDVRSAIDAGREAFRHDSDDFESGSDSRPTSRQGRRIPS